jgi:hypothetical protein
MTFLGFVPTWLSRLGKKIGSRKIFDFFSKSNFWPDPIFSPSQQNPVQLPPKKPLNTLAAIPEDRFLPKPTVLSEPT